MPPIDASSECLEDEMLADNGHAAGLIVANVLIESLQRDTERGKGVLTMGGEVRQVRQVRQEGY